MRPINYTRKGRGIKFIYKLSEFKTWYKLGKESGDVGFCLMGRDGVFDVYLCFGTIEAPCKEPRKVHVEHCDLFDGKRVSPYRIVNPVSRKEGKYPLVILNPTHSFVVIDLK